MVAMVQVRVLDFYEARLKESDSTWLQTLSDFKPVLLGDALAPGGHPNNFHPGLLEIKIRLSKSEAIHHKVTIKSLFESKLSENYYFLVTRIL